MELYTITISFFIAVNLIGSLSCLLLIKNNVIANYDRAVRESNDRVRKLAKQNTELVAELEELKERT